MSELDELLHSIASQTLPPSEIIIVTDGKADEINHLSGGIVKIINHKKRVKQPGPLRNLGLKYVGNKYIFITDDDDIWHTKKAELQLNYMRKCEADLCFCKSSKICNIDLSLLDNEYKKYRF